MSHHCHATECPVEVPPEMLFCKRHWFMLPSAIRVQVWRTYRPGQCDDWNPSAAYCEAAKAAVIYVAQKENKTPDVHLYDWFLASRRPAT